MTALLKKKNAKEDVDVHSTFTVNEAKFGRDDMQKRSLESSKRMIHGGSSPSIVFAAFLPYFPTAVKIKIEQIFPHATNCGLLNKQPEEAIGIPYSPTRLRTQCRFCWTHWPIIHNQITKARARIQSYHNVAQLCSHGICYTFTNIALPKSYAIFKAAKVP